MSVIRGTDMSNKEKRLQEARESCGKCHDESVGQEWAIDDVNGEELEVIYL